MSRPHRSLLYFSWFEGEGAFVVKFLALFLGTVLVIGLFTHYAGLGSDSYGVVHFAQHLSRGKFYSDYPVYHWFKTDWEKGKGYWVLGGNYHLRDGKMFCKYMIGYPLLLAASLRLFGACSIYFFNIFSLVLLLLLYFLFVREVLSFRSHRDLLALGATVLLLLLIEKIWDTAVKPVHDLPALTVLIAGLYLGIRSLANRGRISWGFLVSGSFCLGFSGSVRLPNVLIAFPAAAYLFSRLIGKARAGKIWLVIAAVAIAFALGLVPVLIQNQLSTGNPLKP
ncbi:MAG: hypothetical protein NTV79_01315, partial [Candidatus Aureabacteria bacterium]|nr:hypothetical protein [Candidatus Auribacterota bacterium]